ncbi:MAG TPA: polysaccharide biosynthesis C-terminal domain-containing protein [Bryocella sp.]|nr:polysaccharide biosynthesis C-terminal domain-containing protein [Bryocella sp.]
MSSSWRPLARNIVQLASGEIPARLCGIAVLLLLARTYGVIIVGVYALAQSMTQYSYPFIDFGLRHVGARLIARYPQAGQVIVKRVQKRRLLMASTILPFLLVYAMVANLPPNFKVFVFVFAGISCLYAVSLEWAAWGKEHLGLVGFSKMLVPGSILIFLLLGRGSDRLLWWLIAGNAFGYIVQGVIFWRWWRVHRPAVADVNGAIPAEVQESLAWKRTSVMGLAWFCNLCFNTIDMLMLGVMSNAHEVGLYSAAYRIMNQVLFTYYLLTSILYPRLARQDVKQRVRALRPKILLTLAATGAVIALPLAIYSREVLLIVFGQKFLAATLLLSLLAWAIPLDFLTSYLSNAYFAWSMEKKVLVCTAIGAGSNVVFNLIWIPQYGAKAAAVNTLISYVVFLGSLALVGRYASEVGRSGQPVAASSTTD